jgi:hypothetical protein
MTTHTAEKMHVVTDLVGYSGLAFTDGCEVARLSNSPLPIAETRDIAKRLAIAWNTLPAVVAALEEVVYTHDDIDPHDDGSSGDFLLRMGPVVDAIRDAIRDALAADKGEA